MHQWKKILAERKLIKEVTIEGCNLSITLHDQYNNKDNYYSINTMFSNLWYLNSEFSAVFERATPHNNAPYLKLHKINTYPTVKAAINALIGFGSNTLKNSNVVALPSDEVGVIAPDEEEEVEHEVKIVKPKKKRGIIHPWKKLLSNGELIQSLEIKESLVFVKLIEQYNKKSFYKAINIMLQKLYDKSTDCQKTYRRPTTHTSCPYLIVLDQNSLHDPATLLNGLIHSAKQGASNNPKAFKKPESGSVLVVQKTEVPSKPVQSVAKVEDLYGIFKELLEDPVGEPEPPEFSLTDIESDRPFLGFEFMLPNKRSTVSTDLPVHQPVANDEKKVPVIRLKLNKK